MSNIDMGQVITLDAKRQDARARAHARISIWRDEQEHAGVVFDHGGRLWDGDDASLKRIEGAIGGGLGAVPGFFWTDHENADVPMDSVQLEGLLSAMHAARALRGFAIHQRQREMKDEVAAMTDLEALAAFEPGWPDTQEA